MTGTDAFALRQYDGRVGRWYNPAPYGQNYSPYMAMGNNPVMMIDPDGGWYFDAGFDAATGIQNGIMALIGAGAANFNVKETLLNFEAKQDAVLQK